MLQDLNSRQIGEWMAFGMLEQIGEKVPPDPEEVAKAKARAKRDSIESGLRALKNKKGVS